MYKFFINRPVTTWMLALSFIILGIYGYKNIPIDRFPDVDFPFVAITTTYKGASPEVIDANITKKIEDSLSSISGIEAIVSKSYTGISRVTVIFSIDKNLDVAVNEVRDAINRVSKVLPEEADTPVVQRINTSLAPIMAVLLHGDVDYKQLSYYADKVVKREFERINGVGGVALGGFQDLVMWVRLNPEKMKVYNTTPIEVLKAIKDNNVETPSGRIDSKDKEYVIRVVGKVKAANDINNIIIKENVKIKDIGVAKFGFDELRSIVRFKSSKDKKSHRAIALIVYKQSKTNTVNVADRVKEKIKELNKILPEGMRLDINYDASEFIKKSIKDAVHEVIIGSILTAITIFLFLGSLRLTFVPFMAIPISIFATIFLMYFFGFSLNMISLMAMAVAVGLVIDDAIVVMESIFRRKEEGLDNKNAAIIGTRVVIFAVLASTASLIAIFLPVLFMKSVIGKFFSNFAFVLVVAISVSFIVSMSFTPSVTARLLKNKVKKNIFQKGYEKFELLFDKSLRWSLNHKLIVLFLAFMTVVAGFSLNKYVKKEFLPLVDEGRFIIRFETPTGSSFEFTNKKAKEIEKILQSNPYILRYGLALGEGIVGRPEVNGGMFFVTLIDRSKRPHQKVIMSQLRKEFSKLKDVKAIIDLPSAVGARMGRSADIMYIIKGPDIKKLSQIAGQIVEKLQQLKGFVDVDTDIRISKPEIEVLIDREKAQKDGVSIKEISQTVQMLFSKYTAGTFDKGSESYNIYMKIEKRYTRFFDSLKRVYIRTRSGNLVSLANYIKLKPKASYNVINRYNRQYAATIYANLEGISTGEAIKKVEDIIKKTLPDKYTYEIGGQTKEFKRSFIYLKTALLVSIVVVYMILASLFESLLHPIAILLMLPFAIFGIFGFILITHTTLNVASYFGIILLVGLITRDAVLFIDRIIQLKNEMPIREAILQARKERLRPILMTTFTVIASLIPVAIGISSGSEMRQPMAVAIIGGLLTALPLSLFIIPIIYEIIDKVENKIKEKIL